jgi:23S rRNA pseudouridine2605 synthase
MDKKSSFKKKSDIRPKKGGKKNIAEGILKSSKRKTSPGKKEAGHHKQGDDDKLIRLNRYIASAGICSRRQADEFIGAGLVTINDKLVTELGVKVGPDDVVKYNGERIKDERKVYILLNKPKDYITTVEDPHATKTVLDLVKNACKERIYPVGRLDRNTTGVLLLTNDGDLTKRLTHPKFNKLKIYHIQLDKSLKPADMQKISDGLNLEDGFIKADAISYPDPSDKAQVGIEIHSGRNRIVRRIFEFLNYRVTKLDRVYFAGLTKKGLPRGRWRFLTDKEIVMLKMNAYK